MNIRSFVKLFITTLLLVPTQAPSSSSAVFSAIGLRLADGSSCTPWTPTTCIPGARPEVPSPFVHRESKQMADGSQCIPWRPESCPLKVGRQG